MPTNLFPAGSYSFTAALTNISTGCTSNASTWRCYPFSTYQPSTPDLSSATFYWIIEPVTTYSYVISSSDNPFAPSFANVSLTLEDANLDTERFTFEFTMKKPVTTSAPLEVGNDKAAVCWFNQTVMSATIWTRIRASYPANITSVEAPVNATNVFAPWPFKVEVNQGQGGAGKSNSAPDCRDSRGRPMGGDLRPDVNETSDGAGTDCSCRYANFELSLGNPANASIAGPALRWRRGSG